jgi:hypothetical protein
MTPASASTEWVSLNVISRREVSMAKGFGIWDFGFGNYETLSSV